MQIGKVEFMKAVNGVGKLTGVEVDEFVIDLFCEAIEPHGWVNGVNALKKLALSSRRFPTVFDVLEIVAPAQVKELDDKNEASLAAIRVWDAIGKYGTADANKGYCRAREYIGELGWAVVGGTWSRICNDTKTDDKKTLIAQWRDAIAGTLARAKMGLSAAPGLPRGESADLYLPPKAQLALEPSSGSFLEVAQKAVARSVDRQSRAAGEKDDEREDLW